MWSTKLQNQYFNNSRSALLYRLDSLRCYHVRTIIRFKWSKKGTPFHEKKYFPICHHKNMVLLFLFWKKRKLVLGDYFTWFWPVETIGKMRKMTCQNFNAVEPEITYSLKKEKMKNLLQILIHYVQITISVCTEVLRRNF